MVATNVFIIHPEKDNDILQKLVCEYNDRTLGANTLKIRFIDSSQPLQPYFDFGEKNKSEIDTSECVLAIVTTNSKKSIWVNQEIDYTLGKGIPLLPVKTSTMTSRGCGFLHSNIDSQIIKGNQTRFPRIDLFFKNKFGKMETEIIPDTLIMDPIGEDQTELTGRSEPSAN